MMVETNESTCRARWDADKPENESKGLDMARRGPGDVITYVDELDANKRHDQPAQAIDQQVSAQQQGRATARYCTPRKASAPGR